MYLSKVSQRFVEFYQNRGYTKTPGVQLVHPSVPMSFVMSAGFGDLETRLENLRFHSQDRYFLIQKCFRHFDIEKVGSSDIHLSLFEMPGAFMFGVNHMVNAIQLMWEILTESLGLPRKALWVTYFGGGRLGQHRLPEDAITRKTWLKLGLDPNHLLPLGIDSNFWLQGGGISDEVHRKCGFNTEIFYDQGVNESCDSNCRPGCNCGRFVEIGNVLLIDQRFGVESGRLQPIKLPFSEAVLGSDRITMILEEKKSVFELETMTPLMDIVNRYISLNERQDHYSQTRKKILVDHVRAIYYLVKDGAPKAGKSGRRRIMRKLIRSTFTQKICLGIQGPVFSDLLKALTYGSTEREEALGIRATVLEYFGEEDNKFQKTLNRGERQLERWLSSNGHHTLTGPQIVALEKEFGVPHELTEQMLISRRLPFAQKEFKTALAKWWSQLDRQNLLDGKMISI